MGWLGRGLGDFGSQVGQGFDINLGWKERLQQMALANARQKLADLMGPLQVQQLQQEIKQRGAPQYEGTVNLPGGGLGGISREPNTGAITMNQITPANITADFVGRQILNGRASLSPADQAYADQLLGNLRNPSIDPSKVLDEWQRFFAGAAKGQKQKRPDVNLGSGRVTTYDPYGNVGQEYDIFDAKGNVKEDLPPEIKSLVTSNIAAQDLAEQRRLRGEQATQGAAMQRLLQSEQFREGQVQAADVYKDATTAVTQAINAFNRYQSATTGQTKVAAASHWYEPWTWGNVGLFQNEVDDAAADAEGKRIDAIQKLKAAGMPIPAWLTRPVGAGSVAAPSHPPPPGFALDQAPSQGNQNKTIDITQPIPVIQQ